MPRQITNSFTSYEFTEEEIQEAVALPPMLRMYLQNRLSMLAQEKLNALFDANNMVRFAQLEAELAGKISIISELLDASEAENERKKQELQNSNANKQDFI